MYVGFLMLGAFIGAPPTAKAATVPDRDALRPFNLLIGAWKGTGRPEGTREERAREFWVETITWEWQFRGQKAWLIAAFEKGRHFTLGKLEPLPDSPEAFRLSLTTTDKAVHVFEGSLKKGVLSASRVDDSAKEEQRITLSLLHDNRYLYSYETRSKGSATPFVKKYLVGATKQGVPFAEVPQWPECIVTGGRGSSKVSHNGVDFWVCCSGCRDAFKEDPDKFIKEAAAKKAKK